MKTALLASWVILSLAVTVFPVAAQTSAGLADSQEPEPAQLGEVVVIGTPLRQQAEAFVSAVAAPVRGRKPAVWRDRVCVGVGGMRAEPAQALADRVSQWAGRFGLRSGAPGCEPNIFIVATSDGDKTATELVASRPRQFHTGSDGMNQGYGALRRFQTSDRPIRWWHVSLPVNESTGAPAVRLPGQQPFSPPRVIIGPNDLGSYGNIGLASHLADRTRDDLMQVIIVLDNEALDDADFTQVSDYLAMVALAQVGPDAHPAAPSILNLFDRSKSQEDALTRWDQAYLRGLYEDNPGKTFLSATLSSISSNMATVLQEEPSAAPSLD